MSRKVFTKEQEEYLREIYLGKFNEDITNMINVLMLLVIYLIKSMLTLVIKLLEWLNHLWAMELMEI